ncbi:MAG: hypothetical protein ABSH32_23660 [Bryobacteraceae bacterium]|jgi:hypothetical protein
MNFKYSAVTVILLGVFINGSALAAQTAEEVAGPRPNPVYRTLNCADTVGSDIR